MNQFAFFNLFPTATAASVTSKATETGKTSSQAVEQLLNVIWDKVDNWIAAIVVTIFAVFLARMIRTAVIDRISEHIDEEHQDVLTLTGRATYIAVMAVGVTIALKIAGIDITAIIAAVGFGIGFALQDLIMNFIAGVMILVTRQFNIGDFILINGVIGQVKEIQARSTVLQALDGTKVIVPNKDLFTNMVTSYTTNPFRRIDIPVGVAYGTDLKKAVEVSLQTLQEYPYVLKEPKPTVLLDQFADSSINLIVRYWVESKSNWLGIKSDLIMNLKKNFDSAGINIPFPIRTIYMAKEEQELSKAMEAAGIVPTMKSDIELLAQQSLAAPSQVPKADNPEAPKQAETKPIITVNPPAPPAPIVQNDPKATTTPLDDSGADFLKHIQDKS